MKDGAVRKATRPESVLESVGILNVSNSKKLSHPVAAFLPQYHTAGNALSFRFLATSDDCAHVYNNDRREHKLFAIGRGKL